MLVVTLGLSRDSYFSGATLGGIAVGVVEWCCSIPMHLKLAGGGLLGLCLMCGGKVGGALAGL